MSGLTAAERSYPTSKVRGRNHEDPMPERKRPRGVTPGPRSGAVAESDRLWWRRTGWKELPHVRGQGRQLGGATRHRRPGGQAGRTYPMPEARGSGQENLPNAWGQGRWPGGATPPPRSGGFSGAGDLEELFHVQGQKGRRWGDTPRPM